MNQELGLIIILGCDIYKLVKKVIDKDSVISLLPTAYQVLTDLSAVGKNLPDLLSELIALKGSDQEADLVAKIKSKFSAVVDDAHALSILDAILNLILGLVSHALALEEAIATPVLPVAKIPGDFCPPV